MVDISLEYYLHFFQYFKYWVNRDIRAEISTWARSERSLRWLITMVLYQCGALREFIIFIDITLVIYKNFLIMQYQKNMKKHEKIVDQKNFYRTMNLKVANPFLSYRLNCTCTVIVLLFNLFFIKY